MFDLSIEKIFVLVVAALFVLGPERLPAAAAWLGRTLRYVKGAVGSAEQRLREEIGPDYDQIREPLAQLRAPLQELRTLTDPRGAVLRGLLDPPPPPTAATTDLPLQSRPSAPSGTSAGPPPVDADAT